VLDFDRERSPPQNAAKENCGSSRSFTLNNMKHTDNKPSSYPARSLASWSRKRSKGQLHFIWTTTLWSGAVFFLLFSIPDYLWGTHLGLEWWILRLLFGAAAGVLMSLVTWWVNEAQYRNAKIDAHIKFIEE
jgi:hypothetical protein